MINSEVTKKTNNILKLVTNITDTSFWFPSYDEYKNEIKNNKKLKPKIKKLSKRLTNMISKIMSITTREQDNQKLFKNLNSKV